MFKIASFNVNSLKIRLPQLLAWAEVAKPDVICLQETKSEDPKFPVIDIENAGYNVVFAGQKSYNGVAILARHKIENVLIGNPLFPDPQQRLISASIGKMRIISAYIPNGQEVDSEKYSYKLAWLKALQTWLSAELKTYPNLVLAGDFNIAPEDADVHNPAAWEGKILCSPAERAAFSNLIALGFKDSFRLFPQATKSYSWWDYRAFGFQRNNGMRIDHILLSEPLAAKCCAASIERQVRKNERPSDHAPVVAVLDW